MRVTFFFCFFFSVFVGWFGVLFLCVFQFFLVVFNGFGVWCGFGLILGGFSMGFLGHSWDFLLYSLVGLDLFCPRKV